MSNTKSSWKARAKRFRAIAKSHFNTDISASAALEYMAQIEGLPNWDTLCAASAKDEPETRTDPFKNQSTLPLARRLLSMGYMPDQVARLTATANHHSGLTIISGATGSGKTTSAATVMAYIANKKGRRVMTLEDPIEIEIPGARQYVAGATENFNQHATHILRQDPDAFLFGEIREEAAVNQLVRFAMSGQSTWGTLNENNVLACLVRLDTLSNGKHRDDLLSLARLRQITIISQQVVRLPCPLCKGKGCFACNEGRTDPVVVAEMLIPDATLLEILFAHKPGEITDEAMLAAHDYWIKRLGGIPVIRMIASL